MTLFQSILIGLTYWLGNSSLFASYVTLYRPIVCGFVVGLILGDPAQGAIIGASINLIYIGFMSVGGALPGDPCLAGTLSTALAISLGYDTETAIAVAVPLALLGTILWTVNMTFNSVFVRMMERLIENGKEKYLYVPQFVLPMLFKLLVSGVPVFLMCYVGAGYVEGILNAVNGSFLGALGVVGGMLPAIGVGMNLQAIFKDKARVFLFVGFAITAYTTLPTIALAIFGAALAVIYIQLETKAENAF